MDIAPLINDPELLTALTQLKRKKKTFSDIVDATGNQYVDLVMEGGGMLGIALVGYTWALEQVGIRFLGVGGTSAGSINALLISALGTPEEAKSPKLLNLLASKNFFDFVDGDSDARDFIETWMESSKKGSSLKKVKLAFKAAQVIDNINDNWGLNPGKAFENWIRDVLAMEGIRFLADLHARMAVVPQGLIEKGRDGKDLPIITAEEACTRLAIVAADVATETKVVFPDYADLYFQDPQSVNPASFVRASMSIPYFFEPYKITGLPKGPAAEKRWSEVGYIKEKEGSMPRHGLFVDGGIMSNFPIDLFHDYTKIPSAPTFGVKLEYDQRKQSIKGPLELFFAIFNSSRHCLDYDFLHRNQDYKHLITWIPCKKANGESYNWLDFNMPDQDKAGLFKQGALEAIKFLQDFNWEDYKKLRATMIQPKK